MNNQIRSLPLGSTHTYNASNV